ncbi:hypothetical protein PAMC26510_21875 [Caballeronia sordidicola]|uniref:Uncharacterized protein n=1 Tax=Caballeronia sordidicola TaxID=196367 RepID=A0A242MMS3_CABSO|nr:hypothetical protein PAMC26510_21875 [Caballeronia sordidicola]
MSRPQARGWSGSTLPGEARPRENGRSARRTDMAAKQAASRACKACRREAGRGAMFHLYAPFFFA